MIKKDRLRLGIQAQRSGEYAQGINVLCEVRADGYTELETLESLNGFVSMVATWFNGIVNPRTRLAMGIWDLTSCLKIAGVR